MHAAFKPIGESSLSSAASMNLRFDDKSAIRTDSSRGEIDISQLAGDLLRFIRSRSNFSTRRRRTEFLQQFLRLILVNVHAYARGKPELARGAHRSNGFSSTIEVAAATTCALESGAII